MTVSSILLYSNNTWTMTESLKNRLEGTYMCMWRAAHNVSWRQHMPNSIPYGSLHKVSGCHSWRPTWFWWSLLQKQEWQHSSSPSVVTQSWELFQRKNIHQSTSEWSLLIREDPSRSNGCESKWRKLSLGSLKMMIYMCVGSELDRLDKLRWLARWLDSLNLLISYGGISHVDG